MRLTNLELLNFRNYTSAALSPCPGVTVLFGDNAQGKTNLLESIMLCCTGRSHRTSRDRELLRLDADFGSVKAEVLRGDGTHDIDIMLSLSGRKKVMVNGSQVARSGELMGHINGVLFAPEDLNMVGGGPGERRRFIDMELSQIRPSYYYALQRYNRALDQRNHILREMAAKPSAALSMPEWVHQLAVNGAAVVEYRRSFIEKLSIAANDNHLEISGGAEHLSIMYQPSLPDDTCGAALEAAYERALHDAQRIDERRLTTTVGPHRDDIKLLIDGLDVRVYGSQGQRRTAALSLKLSGLAVMRELTGEWPVLLLDDVMSELDPSRRRHLIGRLKAVQTLVTCTDPGDLAGAEIGTAYRVDHGVLYSG